MTITQMGDAEDAIDFSSYALEDSENGSDGFHVQRLIMKETEKGNLVRYDSDTKRMWTEPSTKEAWETIKAAKANHPYLKKKIELAKAKSQFTPLTEPKLKYSKNFGPSLKFYCLRGGSYRSAKSTAKLLNTITAEHCDICGGRQDSFNRFFASVSHCWETKIWEGVVWETIGSREDIVDFPATANINKKLDLEDYFFEANSKIVDIRIGNNGPNHEAVKPEIYMTDGCFCIMPEGTKDSLNHGASTVAVYCLPYRDGKGEIEGRFHLSTRWLPEHRVSADYPLFLALEAFSENRLELAATMAWASFERSVDNLEKKAKNELSGQEIKSLTEKYYVEKNPKKGLKKSHQVSLMNVILEYYGLAKIEIFAASFPQNAKNLYNARQFVHNPEPTDLERRQIFELLCTGIFGTKLSNALNELFDEKTKREFREKRDIQLMTLKHSIMPKADVCSSEDNDKALDILNAKVNNENDQA